MPENENDYTSCKKFNSANNNNINRATKINKKLCRNSTRRQTTWLGRFNSLFT